MPLDLRDRNAGDILSPAYGDLREEQELNLAGVSRYEWIF